MTKYLSIRYRCLSSSSTSRNKAAKLFSDNAPLPFRSARFSSTPTTLRAKPPAALSSPAHRRPFLLRCREEREEEGDTGG